MLYQSMVYESSFTFVKICRLLIMLFEIVCGMNYIDPFLTMNVGNFGPYMNSTKKTDQNWVNY